MQTRRQSSGRRTRRFLLVVAAAAFFAGGVTATWQSVDDARGATVDAEVVSITANDPGRRVYDVRFAAADGKVCESRLDSGSKPAAREIRVGGTSRVHYSASDPCSKVRESTFPTQWPFAVIAGVVVAFALFSVWHLRPRKAVAAA